MLNTTEKPIDLLRKQLYFQSDHRGMRELDLILGSFAQHHLHLMSKQELLQFEALLAFPDHQIYAWLIEKAPLSNNVSEPLIEMIIDYTYNK